MSNTPRRPKELIHPKKPKHDSSADETFFEPHYASIALLSQATVDWPRYISFVLRGVDAGDDHACYSASALDLHGPPDKGIRWRRDQQRGIKLLRRASRSVHMAMLELASAYEHGEFSLRRNPKKAFELFRRAVVFGSIAGRYHLARCYYFGIGTRVDRRKAGALFRAAAKLGFPVYEEYEQTGA